MRRDPRPDSSIFGVRASRPRPTFRGALWLATSLSVPVFLLLTLVELAVRWATG